MEQLAQWDTDLFTFLNSLGIERYDSFWIVVTTIQNWIPLYVVFFVIFFFSLTRKKAIIAIIGTLLSMVTALFATSLVKNGVGRLRPSNNPDLEGVIRMLQTPSDYSFWSGHAATSFAIVFFVIAILKSRSKWAYLFLIWPVLFSLSRIYVGVHYPSDILVGALVGCCIGALYYKLYSRIIE